MAKYREDFGVLYFVDQNPQFRTMLRTSLESLRRFHADWPVEVIEFESPRVSALRKAYRSVSFWKNKKRRDRAGQDARVVAEKAGVMLRSPFKTTLYLDVDTIVMRPLDELVERARQCDVLVTPLPWKKYERLQAWQPKTFPMLMAGINFFSDHFAEVYRPYVERLGPTAASLPTMDQFIFSLSCEMESQNLRIQHEPLLQIDVINADRQLGTEDFPRTGEYIDLACAELAPFHIFHYNEFKPQYMQQIKEVWDLPSDDDADAKSGRAKRYSTSSTL